MGDKRKIIVFETLNLFNFVLAIIYCKMEFEIMYFKISNIAERLKRFIAYRRQFPISEIWKDQFCFFDGRCSANKQTLSNIDSVYDLFLAKNKSIKIIMLLFKSDIIHFMYKKIISERLLSFYRHQILLNTLIEKTDYANVYYAPLESIYFIGLSRNHHSLYILDKKIKIVKFPFVLNFFTVLFEKVTQISLLAVWPFVLVNNIKRVSLHRAHPQEYCTAIRIYKTGFNFNSKCRTIDFLVDKKGITKDNTLFCIETEIDKDFRDGLIKRRYNFVDIPSILKEEISIDFIKEIYFRTLLPVWLKLYVVSFFELPFVVYSFRSILGLYLRWSVFLHKYTIKNYVVYNDYTFSHIIRNILFSQRGIETWYYAHSCHTHDLFVPSPASEDIKVVDFCYLYYDNFVSWGEKLSSYLMRHDNRIDNFINIGCLWSEHIRRIIETGDYGDIIGKIYTRHKQSKKDFKKIIGVFDTSFAGKTAPLTFYDMKCFLEGILRLRDEKKDFVFLVKPKHLLHDLKEIIPEAISYYRKMEARDRFYLLEGLHDPSLVNAICDLTISACFTSTTSELIGSRKKAIYFDAADCFRGCYYDNFPNLVAHGYDELVKLVDYWLYAINDEEFSKYIDTYIKGKIDPYVDGRAITRFRELLTKQ